MNRSRHPLVANIEPTRMWRRTIDKERKASAKTWNELHLLAQNRDQWRTFAICSPGDVDYESSEYINIY